VLDAALPPGLVSRELRDGSAQILVMAGYNPEIVTAAGIEVIAFLGRHRVRFASDDAGKSREDHAVLILRRGPGRLGDVVDAPRPLDTGDDPAELCRKLIGLAVETRPDLDAGQLAEACMRSTAMLPTYLGHGAVLFHLYSERLDKRLVVRARVARGPAGFPAPLQLAWIVISPTHDPEGHLATLAEVARATRMWARETGP